MRFPPGSQISIATEAVSVEETICHHNIRTKTAADSKVRNLERLLPNRPEHVFEHGQHNRTRIVDSHSAWLRWVHKFVGSSRRISMLVQVGNA